MNVPLPLPSIDHSVVPTWFEKAVANAPEARMVHVEGKNIEVLSWGPCDAPGLLLLHGNLANAYWWSFIAPFFMDRFRVVAATFSGMGGSSHAQPPYTVEGYAEEMMAVVRAEGLIRAHARFSVIAHSAGGGVAARMAACHGGLIEHLVIIDSLIAPGRPAPTMSNDQPLRVYASKQEAVARYRLVPPQPETNRFLIDWIADHSLRPVDGGWQWSFDPWLRGAFIARAAWDYVTEARCPLIFINGGSSTVSTPERIAALRARVPDASFLTIPEAHHHVMIDQPLSLVAALGAILDLGPCRRPPLR